jgi:hypothetical protein
VASVLSGRLLVTFLYATRGAEPPVMLAAAGLLAAAAAVASWLPARHAAATEPRRAIADQ